MPCGGQTGAAARRGRPRPTTGRRNGSFFGCLTSCLTAFFLQSKTICKKRARKGAYTKVYFYAAKTKNTLLGVKALLIFDTECYNWWNIAPMM